MFAALIAVAMVVVWIWLIVAVVTSITSGRVEYLIGLALLTPVILVMERLGFMALDHLAGPE